MSRFHGIVISMYFDEDPHPGRPHFHAEYAGEEASFDIETLEVIAGGLPRRARRLVLKWARRHQDELRQNWQRARDEDPPLWIAPLP